MKVWQHFKTITAHRLLVGKYCFRIGLYRQGLVHDLSKYSPVEFFVGCKYYQGDRSPNNAEKEATGVSLAWLHHKGRNKHHFEYWIDYVLDGGVHLGGMKMPVNYFAEMVMDRIAAAKIYEKDAYTDASPLRYYERGKAHTLMHEETQELLEKVLTMLAEEGEEKTFSYIKKNLLRQEKRHFLQCINLFSGKKRAE